MKAIVMTAQNAREFEKLGGLTITKPIKPAPAAYVEGAQMLESVEAPGRWYVADVDGTPLLDSGNVFDPPVQTGDIVFLREPWARLKNPANGEPSDHVILAADSTVSEGQTAYKWASPVLRARVGRHPGGCKGRRLSHIENGQRRRDPCL